MWLDGHYLLAQLIIDVLHCAVPGILLCLESEQHHYNMRSMLANHISATTLKVSYERPYECNATDKNNFHQNLLLQIEGTFSSGMR
jgi:hypothetical protein